MHFVFYPLSKIILFHYFKSGILNKPHIFYLKPYSILNRAIILFFENTKCVCLVECILFVQSFETGLNSFGVVNQKLFKFCCFEKEENALSKKIK